MTLKEYFPSPAMNTKDGPLYYVDTAYECLLENKDIITPSGTSVVIWKLQKHIEEFLTKRDEYGNLELKYYQILFRNINENFPTRPRILIEAINRKQKDRFYIRHRLIHYFNASAVNAVNCISPQMFQIARELLSYTERHYGDRELYGSA